jgi:hypothetical protein
MKKLYVAIVLSLVWMSIGAVVQEYKLETPKEDDAAATKPTGQPVKSDAMKCCEGMEKMGELKADMPMKSGMTPEMKATMMETMKEKMTDKAPEKKSSDLPAKGQAEKSQSNTDVHQHQKIASAVKSKSTWRYYTHAVFCLGAPKLTVKV